SLRVDKQLALIPLQVQEVRKSGLTIAAEAARDAMRRRIGKKVADADLLEGVRAAYRAGWRSVKLYFMVGFPGETDDDVRGIVELARQVAWERKAIAGSPASVTASVSPLVPKPHTPFQWAGQRDGEYFHQCRETLKSLAKRTPVMVRFHKIERSLLEAVFSRGDRRVGRAIELAWRSGARFDGWDECFDYQRWLDAFAAAGLDPAFYSQRVRPADEILPWDHIESGTPRHVLERSAREADLLG
ncbi:MAG: B12-binding domain-containing radical SAM protein, partial [Phycisphaerae bacterium]|nr:B12-binding domain-containing radical SAM protein [Phycisphaerae bacterium]